MEKRLLVLLLAIFILIVPIVTCSLQLSQQENLSLTPGNSTKSVFNLTTNSTEGNVSLNLEDYYLVYNFDDKIKNNSYKNFIFIIPYSSNLTTNLSWGNSTNNLTITLKNLRTGKNFLNNSGSNPTIINLNSSQVSYGIWQASIFGQNVSGEENFNLTIKFLDNRFRVNFTKVEHKFENKLIETNTTTNLTFYVDNSSVTSINISLNSNAASDLNLSLYNSTNLINSTTTINGSASIFTTNITEGYWKVLINNTNQTANFTYNLTITLFGNNITKLGNITNESITFVYFNLTSPKNLVVNGNYNSVIIITASNNPFELPLNINLSAPILKLKPTWSENYYIGNQSLFTGEAETYNATRQLYLNIGQNKTLEFIINNSGDLALLNLSKINSNLTGSNLNLSFESITLTQNISSNSISYLNITIEPPKNSSYIGNYQGWIYLNSSNAQPFSYLNLSLNITVTNQTLPRLNKPNKVYYFESNNLTLVGFYVYFFDNNTKDTFWNTSKQYNLQLVNSTNNSQVLQNLTFNVSSLSLFSGKINTTNLTEGNYTLLGNLTDLKDNFVKVNLTFELLHNLELSPSIPDSIVLGYPFDLTVNISKSLGKSTAKNVSVCIELPSTIINLSSLCNNSVGDINSTNSALVTFKLNGTERRDYTINITAISFDKRFNATKQQEVKIKYGVLNLTWITAPPSSKTNNTEFTIEVKVKNIGDWNATNVKVAISLDSGLNIVSGDSSWNVGTLAIDDSKTYEWKLKGVTTGTKSITITATGDNATSSELNADVKIEASTENQNNQNQNQQNQQVYDILFLEPTTNELSILQGQSKSLEVKIKNTGNTKLTNCYLTISGINSSLYTITPNDKVDLDASKTISYEILFSIPEDFEAKNYNIKLNFKSDQYNESKTITLKIEKVEIEINLTKIEIVQGESKSFEFTIENKGDVNLYDISLTLLGIDKSYFTLSPEKISSLSKNMKTYATLNLTIPKTEEIGYRELTLNIYTNEKNFTKKINLTILPCEEEKTKINSSFLELLSKFNNLTEQLKLAKNKGKNVSSVEQEYNEIKNEIETLKNYINQGDYIKAKALIASLNPKIKNALNDLQAIKEKQGGYNLILIAVILTLLALFSIILIYTFVIPKKKYEIGSYKYKRPSEFSIKLKNIPNLFNKLFRRKSREEVIWEKKVKEWEDYYKSLKKKKKYGE